MNANCNGKNDGFHLSYVNNSTVYNKLIWLLLNTNIYFSFYFFHFTQSFISFYLLWLVFSSFLFFVLVLLLSLLLLLLLLFVYIHCLIELVYDFFFNSLRWMNLFVNFLVCFVYSVFFYFYFARRERVHYAKSRTVGTGETELFFLFRRFLRESCIDASDCEIISRYGNSSWQVNYESESRMAWIRSIAAKLA